MSRSFRPRAAILAAVLILFVALPVIARADAVFPVSINGTLYRNDMPPVRVRCSGNDGNTMTFQNGDVDLDTLPSITIVPSCGLHSSQGLFENGEAWNGEVIDEEAMQTIVSRSDHGPESLQKTLALEKMTTPSLQDLRMVLDYWARFEIDASGSLAPPILSAKGSIFMANDAADTIFVGTFQTGRPIAP